MPGIGGREEGSPAAKETVLVSRLHVLEDLVVPIEVDATKLAKGVAGEAALCQRALVISLLVVPVELCFRVELLLRNKHL